MTSSPLIKRLLGERLRKSDYRSAGVCGEGCRVSPGEMRGLIETVQQVDEEEMRLSGAPAALVEKILKSQMTFFIIIIFRDFMKTVNYWWNKK